MKVDQSLAFLLEFFAQAKITRARHTYLRALLDQITPDEMREAVVKTLVESFAHLPTMKQIRATWEDIRQAYWQRLKLAPLLPRDFGPAADPVHAARSFVLIRGLLAGRVTGTTRLRACEEMARDFPGVGWEEAVKWAAQNPGKPPPKSWGD